MPEERVTRDPDGELVITTPLVSQLQSLRTEQATGFAKLDTKLDTTVARLEQRIDGHERRIGDVETWQRTADVTAEVRGKDHSKLLTRREKFWGGVGVAALVVSSLLAPVIEHVLSGH